MGFPDFPKYPSNYHMPGFSNSDFCITIKKTFEKFFCRWTFVYFYLPPKLNVIPNVIGYLALPGNMYNVFFMKMTERAKLVYIQIRFPKRALTGSTKLPNFHRKSLILTGILSFHIRIQGPSLHLPWSIFL